MEWVLRRVLVDGRREIQLLKSSHKEYETGVAKRLSNNDNACPPIMTLAMLARALAPGPWPKAMGTIAAINITVVIKIGRNRFWRLRDLRAWENSFIRQVGSTHG